VRQCGPSETPAQDRLSERRMVTNVPELKDQLFGFMIRRQRDAAHLVEASATEPFIDPTSIFDEIRDTCERLGITV
jgi:hypothetical protein